jgi:hypothetical protein
MVKTSMKEDEEENKMQKPIRFKYNDLFLL